MNAVLENGRIRAEISPLGAEPVSIKFCGRERLWQNENGAWAGHAPVLFPVCGMRPFCDGGKTLRLPRHGFARKSHFLLSFCDGKRAEFTLSASAETKKLYPYDFVLKAEYEIEEDGLRARFEASNLGEKPMPLSLGGHFSFALFSPISGYVLLFEKEERFLSLGHDEEGLLTGETADMGTGYELKLAESMFEDGKTLIFGNVRSRTVSLFSEGNCELRFSFGGATNLLLWRPQGGSAVCIEPWGNLPHRAGEDFAPLPICLSKGERAVLCQKIRYYEVTP